MIAAFLTVNIAFAIILLTIAISDLMSFKDKTVVELGGWSILSFAIELYLGSFLLIITLISVAENAVKVTS